MGTVSASEAGELVVQFSGFFTIVSDVFKEFHHDFPAYDSSIPQQEQDNDKQRENSHS